MTPQRSPSTCWNPVRVQQLLHSDHQGRPTSDQPFTQITTDSRAVIPGALFIAIKGDQFDGHQFVGQAVQKGAAAVIIDQELSDPSILEQATVFLVRSTLDAIRMLSAHHRSQFQIPVVAVVGAVGKTTTKELLASLLRGKFKAVHKTEGSLNGFLGIPLTLLELTPEHQIAVIEIGIDEIGAMEKHLNVVRPTHVILTANGPEHLHQLKTLEIAASEELKAFDYALAHEIPMAINLNDPFVCQWVAQNQKQLDENLCRFYHLNGESLSKAAFPNTWIGAFDPAAKTVEIKKPAQDLNPFGLECPLPGKHHAHNLLAATVMASFFDLSPDELNAGLKTFKTAFGRTEIYSIETGIEIIGDYYNSNPTSVKAALDLLKQRQTDAQVKYPTSKTHAILGDMLELGTDEERFHRELATIIVSLNIDSVWLYGPRMKWLSNELSLRHPKISQKHFDSQEPLSAMVKPMLSPGDQVLIKGSRGMRMEKVLESILGRPLPKS
jgi:UDP-N-acetylmuramoyl-tripeptide--D-alanyl-D-alanine ligase